MPDAVLGAKVEAPTPDGPVTLTVPKGSNSGVTLRLKGRGLYDAHTSKRGDLLARIVVTPARRTGFRTGAFRRDLAQVTPLQTAPQGVIGSPLPSLFNAFSTRSAARR